MRWYKLDTRLRTPENMIISNCALVAMVFYYVLKVSPVYGHTGKPNTNYYCGWPNYSTNPRRPKPTENKFILIEDGLCWLLNH